MIQHVTAIILTLCFIVSTAKPALLEKRPGTPRPGSSWGTAKFNEVLFCADDSDGSDGDATTASQSFHSASTAILAHRKATNNLYELLSFEAHYTTLSLVRHIIKFRIQGAYPDEHSRGRESAQDLAALIRNEKKRKAAQLALYANSYELNTAQILLNYEDYEALDFADLILAHRQKLKIFDSSPFLKWLHLIDDTDKRNIALETLKITRIFPPTPSEISAYIEKYYKV